MGMTLARLAEIVQQTAQMEKYPERVEVVISTELPYMTCGQKPCTGVLCVGMGFDWEANQFRITPEEKVMCLKDTFPSALEYLIGEDCCETQHDYRYEIKQAIKLLRQDMEGTRTFRVIDTKTGKEADTYEIALHEDWAKHLIYCDIDGWAISDDGSLILIDDCGRFAYADRERFKVVWDEDEE